jgi:hypothetical protein
MWRVHTCAMGSPYLEWSTRQKSNPSLGLYRIELPTHGSQDDARHRWMHHGASRCQRVRRASSWSGNDEPVPLYHGDMLVVHLSQHKRQPRHKSCHCFKSASSQRGSLRNMSERHTRNWKRHEKTRCSVNKSWSPSCLHWPLKNHQERAKDECHWVRPHLWGVNIDF